MSMMKIVKSASKQRGISIIEALIGVAIGVGLISVAMAMYQPYQSKKLVREQAQYLLKIRSDIVETFESQGNYTGLSNAWVRAAGNIVPTKMIDGTNIRHVWTAGNTVTIAPGTPSTTFSIALTGLNRDACMGLAQSQAGAGWTTIRVGTTDNPTTAQLDSLCVAAPGTTNVTFISN